MGFFDLAHAVPEELRLGEVLGELGGVETLLPGDYLLRVVEVAPLFRRGGRDGGLAVRPVVYGAFCDGVAELAVAVVVHYWADRSVDGELLPVYTEAGELRVEVGEVPALEERVV